MPANQLKPSRMPNTTSPFSLLFRRSAAFLYDCLLLIALFFIITAVAIGFNDGQAIQHVLWYVFLYLIGFVFFDWFWRHGGQTLGMRAWRIRLEGKEQQPVTLAQTASRYLIGTLLFGFTLLYLPLSGNGTALHDRWSGTRIVKYYR